MHLVESYSLNSGSKIDKPFVYTSYFPLPHDKYITIQCESKYNSKNYSYWQSVINILYPVLEKNGVKIVQVGGANEFSYQYVIDIRGRTNISQLSYVISNSLCHFGPDSLGIHLASSFDVPIVGLFSCSSSNISGPYFGSKEKQILFEAYKRTKNGKPSYAAEESPKSINNIRPEEIASAVLKLLKIEYMPLFETVHMGEKYCAQLVRELIPNFNLQNLNIPIEVRMDLYFDEKILAQQLQLTKCVIITNKPIDINLLRQFKQNIVALVYEVDKNDKPDFIKQARTLGVQMVLVSYLSPEDVQAKKLDYYEIGKICRIEPPTEELVNKLKAELPNLYYQANKITASNGQFYMTNAGVINNQTIQNDFNFHKVIDCPEFWKDLPFTHIVKKV